MATNMSVPIERGRTWELSSLAGKFASLFETRGSPIPAVTGTQTERRKDGTLPNHAATTPPSGQPSPRPLSAAPRGAPPQREPRVALNSAAAAWRTGSIIGGYNRLPKRRTRSHPGSLYDVISDVISPSVHFEMPSG